MHVNSVCYISLLLLIIKKYSFMEIIRLNDDTPLNSKLYDLRQLIPGTKMTYHLLQQHNAHSYFVIKNDHLYTNMLLDIDTMCQKIGECCKKENDNCEFIIGIAGKENPETELSTKNIKICIQDTNDNYPVFSNKHLEIDVSESVKTGHIISLPTATDNDFGNNRVESYKIVRQEPRTFDQDFRLNFYKTSSFFKVELKICKQLDRETTGKYSFDLLAIDGGYMDLKTGSINIIIRVIDENDNIPQFSKSIYKESVKEGIFNSVPILRLSATDPDEGLNGKILYKFHPDSKNDAIIRDNFTINEDSGEVYLRKALDFEQQTSFKFTIIAINPKPSVQHLLTSKATVEIIVKNVYDEPLNINVDYVNNKNYSFVEENKNNVFVAFVSVKSKETPDQFPTSIQCNLEGFTDILTLTTKGEDNYQSKSYEIRTIGEIDRENLSKISTKVLCKESTDAHIPWSSAKIEIFIQDQNDNAPTLTTSGSPSILENSKPGTIVLRIIAQDKDEGENGRVTFSMDKSTFPSLEYLSIGERDGMIRVKSSIDCEANVVQLTTLTVVITATDHGIKPKSTDLAITITINDVNDNIPKFAISNMYFEVLENNLMYSSVGEIEVEDKDAKDDINLEINSKKHSAMLPFIIVKKSKTSFYLNTTRSLDREQEEKFTFDVIASDSLGSQTHTITGSVVVVVIDQNDNIPVIIFPAQNNATNHVISYLEPKNYKFMTVSANDQDRSNEFNTIEYHLESSTDIFEIDRHDGKISTRREMTRSDIGGHIITITASNPGDNSMKSNVRVNIIIDESPAKSNEPRSENLNGNNGGSMNHSSYINSEIIIAILMVIVFFVVFIIIIIVCVVLRHCHKEPDCLRSLMDKCFHTNLTQTETQVYSPTLKFHAKTDMEYYNDTQQKSVIVRESSNNWSHVNPLAINPNQYVKGSYTKLSNPSHYYIHPSAAYQTIDDSLLNKYPENNVNKHMFNMNNQLNYKSEMNLNTENFFSDHNQELSQINEQGKVRWIASLTPMQIRSKSVVSKVISNEQPVENNFAVVYPQEQSTFV